MCVTGSPPEGHYHMPPVGAENEQLAAEFTRSYEAAPALCYISQRVTVGVVEVGVLHVISPGLLRQPIVARHVFFGAARFRIRAAGRGGSKRPLRKVFISALRYLRASDTTLTFKGGTCLAKVRAGFYSALTRKDQPEKRCGDLQVEIPGLLVNSSKWRQCDFQQMEYRR
jgi:hypothetical protein